MVDFSAIHPLLLLLLCGGILVPILNRLHVSAVIGYLLLGIVVGPYGIGQLTHEYEWLSPFLFDASETKTMHVIGELGVVLLMFMIGLELSFQRLYSMRRLVFGLGSLQVVITALVIAVIARAFGNGMEASLVLGLGLALSSTAIVMQWMIEKRRHATPSGILSLSVLIMQDLAVMPMLVLLAVLGLGAASEVSVWELAGEAVLKAVGVTVAILVFGRVIMHRIFQLVSTARSAEWFLSLTALIVFGCALLSYEAGLSMAFGAFLAGLLLSGGEYHHEIQLTLDPFKGLLMGVFFLSVGMGIDVNAFLDKPVLIPLSVFGMFVIKGVIIFVLARLYGFSTGVAVESSMLLGQAGEFGFLVVGAALVTGLIPPSTAQFMLLVTGFSMIATPPIAELAQRIGQRFATSRDAHSSEHTKMEDWREGHVIIAGYGRVGQQVAEILQDFRIPWVAIDMNVANVTRCKRRDLPVYFGDARRRAMYEKLHAEGAEMVILTLDQPEAARSTLQVLRKQYPNLRIVARAHSEQHGKALKQMGAAHVSIEPLETGLQLASRTLEEMHIPLASISDVLDKIRDVRCDPEPVAKKKV